MMAKYFGTSSVNICGDHWKEKYPNNLLSWIQVRDLHSEMNLLAYLLGTRVPGRIGSSEKGAWAPRAASELSKELPAQPTANTHLGFAPENASPGRSGV